MKYVNKLISATLLVVTAVACTDEDIVGHVMPDKPESVAFNEYLNGFDLLKTYINREQSPVFQLGASLSAGDFMNKQIAYSMVCTNFDALDVGNSYTPASGTGADDVVDLSSLSTLTDEARNAGITLYGPTLLSHIAQRATYLNRLIEPLVIPAVPEKGTTIISDFENDALGATYPLTNNATAVVEDDPAGQTGKVLRIGTEAAKVANAFPKFTVTLPADRTLGDYTSLAFDMRIVNQDGIYGSGMFVLINGREFGVGVNAQALGCNPNAWNRGASIKLNDDTPPGFELPDELKSLNTFELAFGTKSGAAQYFLDNIRMNYEAPAGGRTTFDFEGDAVGTSYPMSGNSTATVEADPNGQSGNVLHIGSTATPANQSFPEFQVNLPAGRVLGDYTTVSMDFKGTGSTGLYGGGMRLNIDGVEKQYGSPSSYGCPDGQWGRGAISLNISELGLSAAQLQLTNFVMRVGSGTGSGDYYMDNITLTWKAEDKILEKTPEEKKTILSAELKKWIGGMIDAGGDYIKSWNIVSEPLDDSQPDANTFQWKDYLGEPDYARIAVKMARDTAKIDLNLFVSNTFNIDENSVQKCENLIQLIEGWEGDNITKIDGINVLLHAVYSKDLTQQQANEAVIVQLFEKLAETGKLIRISDLTMSVANAEGVVMNASALTPEERSIAAEYYTVIFKNYFEIIPADKRAGITLGRMSETSNGTLLCPWSANNNRTDMYVGIVDGLKQ